MNIEEIAALAAEEEDFTVESTGGDFERSIPEAGPCLVRFREYIETGFHPTASKQYPDKKPQLMARWVFELVSKKHAIEVKDKDDNISSFNPALAINTKVSKSGKGNHMKLFKILNYAGTAKVPAQLLGKGYMAEIVHNKSEDGKTVYANLNKGISYGDYTFAPARKVDALEGTTEEIAVPEMQGDMKLFLWNMPTKETWDSLFIDGTREEKVNGEVMQVSKNWIQNKCMEALDFPSSKLFELLEGEGNTLDDLPTEEEPPVAEPSGQDEVDALLGV